MLTDARTLANGTVRSADVCIIGAGAAGLTTAMELRETGLSIIVVESGGDDFDDELQDLYAGPSVGQRVRTLQGDLELDEIRLRYFGGTTNHWAGFCRPLTQIDFEPRDHLPVSGWPITHDDLVPYWERAVEWVRIHDADFDAATWADRAGVARSPIDTDVVEAIVFQTSFPTAFGGLYGAELAATPGVEIVRHANVVNLATADGRRIDAADIRTLDGTAVRVEAEAFVLATGGIENARLLLASTDHDPAGVGNANDQVGRHFTEHLQTYAGFGLFDDDAAAFAGFNGGTFTLPEGRHAGFGIGVKLALGLTDAFVRDTATTGMEIQMIADAFPGGTPYQDDGATMADVAALLGGTAAAPASAGYVQGLAEQALDPESRVTLDTTSDALGMRRSRLDWRYSRLDRQRVLDNLRVFAEEFGALGLGRLQLLPGGVQLDVDGAVSGQFLTLYRADPLAVDVDDFPLGVGFHHMCTTRMSADPASGVVDADCRVHGVDNLWVGGSSVFATGGVATPTFTIVALAVRLADHLRDVLSP